MNRRSAVRIAALLATPLVPVGAANVAAAHGAGPVHATSNRAASVPTFAGELFAVAVTGPNNAWAVGTTGAYGSHPKTLIVHFNGTRWTRVPSPAGAVHGYLWGITATSAHNAWAVGTTGADNTGALILRWNGTRWQRWANRRNFGNYALSSVSATSASNAWAVGATRTGTLTLRWNGTTWKRVPSPQPGTSGSSLASVAATSATNAWAVGLTRNGTRFNQLILRWNGTAWRRVASPRPKYAKYGNMLDSVAATSATNAWAVGCTDQCPVVANPVIEHWNGTAWKQVAPPTKPYQLYKLAGVATTSAHTAWAVGGGGPATSEYASTLHFNGHKWTLGKGRSNEGLVAVAASSAANAFAVGGTVHGRTLILHWNGTRWTTS